MQQQMGKVYDPAQVEQQLYQAWEESGAFKGKADRSKKPFCIVMPPPNITGQLHMGHALDNTMQDILTRYHRMLGDATLWLPGTDHASIATEVKIVEAMAKEGLTKNDLGRDKFLERAWEWKKQYGGRIVKQLRKLGSSCDWSRERFTMDEGCSKAVAQVFVKLYQEGLIYRGNRIINWCPACKTALSDAEVEYEEQQSHLYYIRYPAADGGEGVIVATTRPETMLGDTGVAVNPEDARYAHLIGKNLRLPLRDREIPVVADEYVEKEFGTGAVKMTPAHDPNDFEVAMRHNLAIDRIMNDDGTMTDACGKYAGMDGLTCREAVLEDLKALGLLVKIEDYAHNVGTCYRCGHTIEPLVSLQWFVKMKPLAQPAIDAVREGKIRFVPERFDKNYYHWMENTRDWCISRQLWWGHRIPVWYCDCGEVIVEKETPSVCPKCGGTHLKQDEDVLDTWFSSALWPFSTLGWPDKTEDLDYFYPTTALVTGYDIITFWVSRMIVSGLAHMGQAPFGDVLVHGLVRDAQGRKMSKSLGNGIDPLEMIEKYGADALRFSLIFGVAPGNDMRCSDEKIEAARNFANKVWNASRYSIMNLQGSESPEKLSLADQWILTRCAAVTKEITDYLDQYDLGLAAQKLYDFIWTELCDWYLELSKSAMYGEDEAAAAGARWTLRRALTCVLKLLHPFMPFITEEIYRYLSGGEGFLMQAPWPTPDEFPAFPDQAEDMQGVMEIIRAVRAIRAERNVPPSKRAHIMLLPGADFNRKSIETGAVYFERLASASGVTVIESRQDAPKNAISAVCLAGEAFLPLEELVDLKQEKARLEKELKTVEQEIARAQGKLNNAGFVAKAPAAVVDAEREKLRKNQTVRDALQEKLAGF